MHCVEGIGHVAEHTPAKRLDILMPAFAIGSERDQQSLRLLPEFLLQLLALDGARADGALQGPHLRANLCKNLSWPSEIASDRTASHASHPDNRFTWRARTTATSCPWGNVSLNRKAAPCQSPTLRIERTIGFLERVAGVFTVPDGGLMIWSKPISNTRPCFRRRRPQ